MPDGRDGKEKVHQNCFSFCTAFCAYTTNLRCISHMLFVPYIARWDKAEFCVSFRVFGHTHTLSRAAAAWSIDRPSAFCIAGTLRGGRVLVRHDQLR